MNKTVLYAEALYRAHKGNPSRDAEIVASLMEMLRRENRLSLLPGISRALSRRFEKERRHLPEVIVARKEDALRYSKEIEEAGFSGASIRVDSSIIGGWRARRDSILVDASYKSSLISLFNRITSST